jgi:hypothetical protein
MRSRLSCRKIRMAGLEFCFHLQYLLKNEAHGS